MICPGSQIECDNPGCRHGGCQGRLPTLPLFHDIETPVPQTTLAARELQPALRPVATAPAGPIAA